MHLKCSYLLLLLFVAQLSFAQDIKVEELLEKAVNTYSKSKYAIDLEYKLYGTYTTNDFVEAYKGTYFKNDTASYLKINNTTTISNAQENTILKIYEEERIIESYTGNREQNRESPIDISKLIELFKDKTITENKDHYLCSLIADVVTQLPYGKIEIYINKKDFSIDKQVFYFLSAVPYTAKDGTTQLGNPKLEVNLSNFNTSITSGKLKMLEISTYLSKSGTGVNSYKNFKIVKL